jgi:hypothetical protein
MKKLFVILFLGFLSCSLSAQQLNPLYDLQKVHFGFSIIGNSAKTKFTTAQKFLDRDTLKVVEGLKFPGFGVGGLVNVRMTEYLDFRTMVNIQFVERHLDYHFSGGAIEKVRISSTYMEIPVQIKYKSKRHKNTRFYVLAGGTYRYDFASDIETERSDTKPIVALYPNTFSYDLGAGFDFYFEFFKFSPEFRMSNGLGNSLVKDPYIFASSLERISPKLLQFILHFEG